MNRLKAFAVGLCLGLLVVALPMQADQWDQKTLITVREPIALPNTVLQPGDYMMELADAQAYRHVVRIYSADGRDLVATVVGFPAHQMVAANSSEFTFWEAPPGRPPAMRTWYYPGQKYGTMFQYTPQEAIQVAQVTPPPAPPEAPPQPEAAPAPAPQPEEAPPVAPAPPAQPAPPQVTQPVLPRTASPLPLLALFGLLAAAGAGATRAIRKLS
jgi:hypothetical protein